MKIEDINVGDYVLVEIWHDDIRIGDNDGNNVGYHVGGIEYFPGGWFDKIHKVTDFTECGGGIEIYEPDEYDDLIPWLIPYKKITRAFNQIEALMYEMGIDYEKEQ